MLSPCGCHKGGPRDFSLLELDPVLLTHRDASCWTTTLAVLAFNVPASTQTGPMPRVLLSVPKVQIGRTAICQAEAPLLLWNPALKFKDGGENKQSPISNRSTSTGVHDGGGPRQRRARLPALAGAGARHPGHRRPVGMEARPRDRHHLRRAILWH